MGYQTVAEATRVVLAEFPKDRYRRFAVAEMHRWKERNPDKKWDEAAAHAIKWFKARKGNGS